MFFLSRPNELLSEHIERLQHSFKNLCAEKKIDEILNNIVNETLKVEEALEFKDFLFDMISNVFMLHDEGKKSKYFQSYIGNLEFENIPFTDTQKEHSINSAYEYLKIYYKNIENLKLKGASGRKSKRMLKEFTLMFAYIISKHHGALSDYNKGIFLNEIKDRGIKVPDSFYDNYDEQIIKYYSDSTYEFNGENSINIYILIKYIYGVLVVCDYMAVHDFKKGMQLKINVIDSVVKKRFLNKLYNTEVYRSIDSYKNGKIPEREVNLYRCKMFLEAENNIKKTQSSNLMFLEAPTGCGKSITGVNCALNLIDENYNKIVYIAPFNNIMEQTYSDIKCYISDNNKDVALINSKEEIVTIDDDFITDFDIDVMDRQLLNYPCSITSHVTLFDILFGYSRKKLLMLPLLSNSVIILDEIQSYKNKLWISVINSLNKYAALLNIKFIITSATLPKMDCLLETPTSMIDLINNRDYYYNFFSKRVSFDFSLLDKSTCEREENIELLLNAIDNVATEGKRILIGTITIKTCNDLYGKLKDKYTSKGYCVYRITGGTSTARKNEIIRKLKEKDSKNDSYCYKKVMLVATQCVEAGVDIDMDIGFKNISILDSDEQFAGRIARNFNKKGMVYFYKIDEVSKIYKEDYRAERTLENKEWRKILVNKEFNTLYKRTYKWLLEYESSSFVDLKLNMNLLQFRKVSSLMKLIEDDKVNLLMVCKYRDGDAKIIDLEKELMLYNKIRESDLGYSKKQVLLSRFKKIFDMFTVTMNRLDFEQLGIGEDFGIYKRIDNAEKYYTNIVDDCVTADSELNLEYLKLFL